MTKRTFLVSALAAGTTMLAADKNPGEEAAVRAAVTQFVNAAKAGDEAALKKVLSDDLMYSHSSAKVENKAECIAALVKSKPNFMINEGYSVQVYGKSAMVHGTMVAVNGPQKNNLHFMMMWVKDGNAWKMVGRHTARLPS